MYIQVANRMIVFIPLANGMVALCSGLSNWTIEWHYYIQLGSRVAVLYPTGQ